MATPEQRRALLAVACPWCRAGVGEPCGLRSREDTDTEGGRRTRPVRRVTTLDGGCHDARWNAALGTAARVLPAVVAAKVERPAAPAEDDRVLVGAGPPERPW